MQKAKQALGHKIEEALAHGTTIERIETLYEAYEAAFNEEYVTYEERAEMRQADYEEAIDYGSCKAMTMADMG